MEIVWCATLGTFACIVYQTKSNQGSLFKWRKQKQNKIHNPFLLFQKRKQTNVCLNPMYSLGVFKAFVKSLLINIVVQDSWIHEITGKEM